MDYPNYLNRVMQGSIVNNYRLTNPSEVAVKLKIVELLQAEIQKLQANFNVTLGSFLQVLQNQYGIKITHQEILHHLLILDNGGLKFFENLASGVRQSITPLNAVNNISTSENIQASIEFENKELKARYLEALTSKDPKRHFQVYYVFKSKIKRMYRIDCMTRKINVNFYHYLRDNYHSLNINDEFLDFFRSNIRFTSREKFQQLNKKYPQFTDIYNSYLESSSFKKLVSVIKKKYDSEYQKLFYRHSINFLNFYLKEKDPVDVNKKGKLRRLSRKKSK